MKKILIAIDDGPNYEKIAAAGFQLGKLLATDIAIISVVDVAGLMTEGGITPQDLNESIKTDYKKIHQKLLTSVFKDYKTLSFIEEGRSFEAILKTADSFGADLIVIGTHGRTGLSHLLMGSVAEKVIRHSIKPVYIIPTKTEKQSED